jgi:hypothetical protein
MNENQFKTQAEKPLEKLENLIDKMPDQVQGTHNTQKIQMGYVLQSLKRLVNGVQNEDLNP